VDEREARSVIEGPPSFDERVARAEIERDVRAEYSQALTNRRGQERDKRYLALFLSAVLVLGFLSPLLALVLGFSWRVLMWAAGQGW
jgi:hypothetical protein